MPSFTTSRSRSFADYLPPRSTPPEFRDTEDDDNDEGNGQDSSPEVATIPLDMVPCSSPIQPTQVLGRALPLALQQSPTPIHSLSPSPPVIEVPRSSPLQVTKQAHLTKQGMISQFFKATTPITNSTASTTASASPLSGPVTALRITDGNASKKRCFDMIEVSDDDDDDGYNRADIRRTQFASTIKRDGSPKHKKSKLAIGKLDFSSFQYTPPSPKSGKVQTFPDLTKPPLNNATKPAQQSGSKSPEILITSSPPKGRPRRRLVRGLRPRSRSPSPNTSQEAALKSSTPPPAPIVKKKLVRPKPLIISDDEEDELAMDSYVSRDSTPEIVGQSGNKIVDMLNEIIMSDLAALTGDKEDSLTHLLSHRPFRSISQIEKVSKQKTVRGKKQMVNIGEAVVEKISSFTKAISAVDQIVVESDRRAQEIKKEIDSWGMNNVGQATKATSSTTNRGRMWKMGQPANMNPALPMHDYQVFGVNWMNLLFRKGFGGILADDMGLGKTCQVIGLMCRMVQDYEADEMEDMPFPNLIVVPPSTLDNWLAEFEKFAPHLSIVKYSGSQDARNDLVDDLLGDDEVAHVILTSYTQLSTNVDIHNMNRLNIQNAIFDEGQILKNPTTKQYQRLARLKVNWRLLLSGTPIQNHLMEMISLLSFVDPYLFSTHMEEIQYVFDHKIHSKNLSNTALLYGERVNRARSILEPFILQRLKDQIGQNLPKKTQRIIRCDLPDQQRKLYDKYEKLFRAENDQKVKTRKSGARDNDMNNVWIQMKKAALHPQLFRHHFTDKMVHDMAQILYKKVDHRELDLAESKFDLLHNDLRGRSDFDLHLYCTDFPRFLKEFDIEVDSWKTSGKVLKLLEMIDEYKKNGDRVLVFSKFSMVIDILSYILNRDGIPHCQLTGKSAVGDRQAEINRFQRNPDIPVFLLTTGAGGTGINLTAANKVVIFDMSSNPQDDKQAENRAHRLGQTRPVEVIHLIARNTVEELIYLTCQKKIELADKVITSGAGSGAATAEATATGTSEGAAETQLKNTVRGLMDQGYTVNSDDE
ncbi:ATP-dependent helicase fft2 [Ceratocystis fimbriata CBS 114723]|uniref:ATP-dependent helicase fft2 n=1 Tax=Ceratocystis fimbriata CBS 114723 TaxID=1035309 RepID=A0A2C5X8F5_9PEZI|nr:ATP-dependent helicase fft2 [Ceratocystis fimbriata CBS 114723]